MIFSLPALPFSPPLASVFAAIFNHLMAQSPWLNAELQPFAGKTLALTLQPISLTVQIQADGHLHPLHAASDAPHARIETTLAHLPLLMGDEAGRRQAVSISGDTALAAAFASVLAALRWQPDASLAPFVGQVAALPLANWLGTQWYRLQALSHSVLAQSAEYLTDEAQLLADPLAVRHFVQAVDTLRDDVARLQAKLDWLERTAGSAS